MYSYMCEKYAEYFPILACIIKDQMQIIILFYLMKVANGVGGTVDDAISFSTKMKEITTTENQNVTIPLLNFQDPACRGGH